MRAGDSEGNAGGLRLWIDQTEVRRHIAEYIRPKNITITNKNPHVVVEVVKNYQSYILRPLAVKYSSTKTTWMPAKLTNHCILGPRIAPDNLACPECLCVRLDADYSVARYVTQHSEAAILKDYGLIPESFDQFNFAVHHLIAEIQRAIIPGNELRIISDDSAAGHQWSVHSLPARPQCKECGDPSLQQQISGRPIRMNALSSNYIVRDNGYRTIPPEQFVRETAHLVDKLTGVVKTLNRVDLSIPDYYAYSAGQNLSIPIHSLEDLKTGLRSSAAGKGTSDSQAKASAIGEAIERYSGIHQGDEPIYRARLRELDSPALNPTDLLGYSKLQYAGRKKFDHRINTVEYIPEPFDENQVISWMPAWSLNKERKVLAPAQYCLYGFNERDRRPASMVPNSNGCAAGSTLEEAILQGFFELVERDSVAIWWYNKLLLPKIDLSQYDVPYFAAWQSIYDGLHRQSWLINLTTDLGVPAVAAISRRTDKEREDILMAFGAHFDMKIAISRAMTEMNQFLPAVISEFGKDPEYQTKGTGAQVKWWTESTAESETYLVPTAASNTTHDSPVLEDVSQSPLQAAVDIVADNGMELIVMDQTRPDICVPTARVIVPGLCHFWPRFGFRRLYEVPVKMRWKKHETPEQELNSIAMFL